MKQKRNIISSCYSSCKHHVMLRDAQHNHGWCLYCNKYEQDVKNKECNYEKEDNKVTQYIPFKTKNPEDSVKQYMTALKNAQDTGRCVDCINTRIYDDYIEPITYTFVDILDSCPHKKMIEQYKGETYRIHIEDMQLKIGNNCFNSRIKETK